MTVTVSSTRDYNKFTYAPVNRPVDMDHVERIANEIVEDRNLLPDYPILVKQQEDGTLIVIDGQHRLEAARQTNKPIYYITSSISDVRQIAHANALTKHWDLEDYLHYYRHFSEDYSKLHKLWQEHDFFTLSVIIRTLPKGGKRPLQSFREGFYEYHDEQGEYLRELSAIAQDFSEHYDFWNHRSFILALNEIVRNRDYDHKRMMAKHTYNRIQKQPTKEHYLQALEYVYNYRSTIKVYFTR